MTITSLVIVGLMLDILGAAVLATPDIPTLNQKYPFGRLRRARERMEGDGVTVDNPGFEELVDVLQKLSTVDEAEEKPNSEYKVIDFRRRTGFEPLDIDFNWGSEYIEARYGYDDDYEIADFYEVSDVLIETMEEERRTENLVRAGGLLLMASGFFLQILANGL